MLVLETHGKVESGLLSDDLVQRAFDICVANEYRIQRAVVHCDDFDHQIDSFIDEVENILYEAGLIGGEKQYRAPG